MRFYIYQIKISDKNCAFMVRKCFNFEFEAFFGTETDCWANWQNFVEINK